MEASITRYSPRAIDSLNSRFLKNGIQFSRHSSGLIQAQLNHVDGSSMQVFLSGAHVHSLRCPTGEQLLYMSPEGIESGKALRGGIPIIYPQFGKDGNLDLHGFARTSLWNVVATKNHLNQDLEIVFELKFSDLVDSHRKKFPHECDLRLKMILSAGQLTQHLEITPKQDLEVGLGFHTYFRVQDINHTVLGGLPENSLDLNNREKTLSSPVRPNLGFETARLYPNHGGLTLLGDKARKIILSVAQKGLDDLVIWHAGSREIPGFPMEDRARTICIEPAAVINKAKLTAGTKYTASQSIKFRKLN